MNRIVLLLTVMLAIVCVQRANEFVREGLFYYLPDALNDLDPILA